MLHLSSILPCLVLLMLREMLLCRQVCSCIIVLLYGGKPGENLNKLRYTTYMTMVVIRSAPVRPERLPPSENAAAFHILRVHLQVMQWQTLMQVNKNTKESRWRLSDSLFVPIMSDQDVAPADLLDVIKCSRSMLSRSPCSSQLCSCVKHGLLCLAGSMQKL